MDSTIYIPTKRLFSYKDDFFKEGNIALNAYWLEREATNDSDISMIREEAQSLTKVYTSRPLFCELPSCVKRNGEPIAFPNITAYESHYESQHRYTCQTCQKPFPGSHWLNLHFDECHNVLIQIQKEKGEKIYKCFIETCLKKFSTPKMRRLHLIDKHQYPKYFDYKIVLTGTISFEERQKKYYQKKKAHHQRKIKSTTTTTMDVDENKESTSEEEGDHHCDNNNSTTIRKKKQKDEEKGSENAYMNEKNDIDMEMDSLVEGMSKMKIPSTISFGRGKKATWNRSHRAPSSSLPLSKLKNKNTMEDKQMHQ